MGTKKDQKNRRLALRTERLTELRPDELASMQGGWDTSILLSRCEPCALPTYHCTPVII